MNFQEFSRLLVCKVQLFLGNEYEISTNEVTKNNGVELTGLIAKKEGINTYPTVYINDFYSEFMTENEVEYLAVKLSQRLKNAAPSLDIDISEFTDFNKAKYRIAFKVINGEKNKELLMAVPHRRIHNLAVVYIFIMDNQDLGGRGTILIRNEHADNWEVDEETLYKRSMENMQTILPVQIVKMKDMINEMYGEDIVTEDANMYVVTNKDKFYGAGCICIKEILRDVYNQVGEDYFVLPSSIHEVIVLPDNGKFDIKELLLNVTEINRTQVSDEEILADSVYYYNHEKDELSWLC